MTQRRKEIEEVWTRPEYQASVARGSDVTREIMAMIRARNLSLEEVRSFALHELARRVTSYRASRHSEQLRRASRIVAAWARELSRTSGPAVLRSHRDSTGPKSTRPS